ncbi:hypothetical protein SAMD00019534_057730 [Acytostelium subglobosum LB1]|uniref:hypothetical protein n=1 Tax=Acytostelium subglobosum LB1 TaxID=1410327 RepID=UPI000644FD94|nr:hypothetical protein SAMD00019534_057730 [Acytostelium subglobosum LB1]GAM22598.1 hypothetical protein SAMD00019534_057730 [Acytostelium subglobosum LB1]|eukprot:XP_012754718.1 hypothetical protein SAMD00019534_057730 [Acytostelium subglobosum LB1]
MANDEEESYHIDDQLDQQCQLSMVEPHYNHHLESIAAEEDWFRQPEDWEINLKYLYKWKWRVEMEKHFKRYRKNRTKLIHDEHFKNNVVRSCDSSPCTFVYNFEEGIESGREIDVGHDDEDDQAPGRDELNTLPHDPAFLQSLLDNLDEICHSDGLGRPIESSSTFFDIGDYDLSSFDGLDEDQDFDLEIDDTGALYAVFRSPVGTINSDEEFWSSSLHSSVISETSMSPATTTTTSPTFVQKLYNLVDECSLSPTEEENVMFDQFLEHIKNLQLPMTCEENNINNSSSDEYYSQTSATSSWIPAASEVCE